MNAIEGVLGLQEPDPFTAFTVLRNVGGMALHFTGAQYDWPAHSPTHTYLSTQATSYPCTWARTLTHALAQTQSDGIIGATDDEIITLLRLSVLAHCKPDLVYNRYIFKFQAESTEYMDLFARAFPNSKVGLVWFSSIEKCVISNYYYHHKV